MMNQAPFDDILVWLQKELAGMRTGRAQPSLLESLMVDTYGSQMPLQQLASMTTPEPRLLVVQPWDPQTLKDIEKAIRQSDLALNPAVDGVLIRVPFPPFTEDKRKDMVKIMHEKLEEAKVKLRQARENLLKQWRVQKTNGELSEDDYFRMEKELQGMVDTINQKIGDVGQAKEKDLMTV